VFGTRLETSSVVVSLLGPARILRVGVWLAPLNELFVPYKKK
jgi:hypothetical protein